MKYLEQIEKLASELESLVVSCEENTSIDTLSHYHEKATKLKDKTPPKDTLIALIAFICAMRESNYDFPKKTPDKG